MIEGLRYLIQNELIQVSQSLIKSAIALYADNLFIGVSVAVRKTHGKKSVNFRTIFISKVYLTGTSPFRKMFSSACPGNGDQVISLVQNPSQCSSRRIPATGFCKFPETGNNSAVGREIRFQKSGLAFTHIIFQKLFWKRESFSQHSSA